MGRDGIDLWSIDTADYGEWMCEGHQLRLGRRDEGQQSSGVK